MALRKIICILLSFCFVFSLAGCGNGKAPITEVSSSSFVVSTETSSEENLFSVMNPLTGEKTLAEDRQNKRPVAVMINNISIAQKVQTGVGKADLVFETEVEGGITRLLAVFSDPSVADTIGTIRSARVVYADIANGLGAFYVHHGIDYTYCDPHIKSNGIVRGEIGSPYAYRQSNGLASEHTLYTTGENLLQFLKDRKYDNDVTVKSFANFADTKTEVALSSGKCNFVRVPFSTSYKTDFIYNESTKKYTRAKDKTPLKDYSTGETEEFKNVFVLKTSMSYYSDNYHRKIDLTSGTGYYISNGAYEEIKWTKGSTASSFKFTKKDGSTLTVNAGNSYICITESSNNITIE